MILKKESILPELTTEGFLFKVSNEMKENFSWINTLSG